MTAARPRVAVLYNAPVLPIDHADSASESDVVEVARAVAAALSANSFDATLLAAAPPVMTVLEELERRAPDVVFNLIEGFGGESAGATDMTGLLRLAGFAYTGSPVESLALCVAKSRTKGFLRGIGLPTAPSLVVSPGGRVPEWDWPGPALVKPDTEDGSLGIDQGSVVSDREAAQRRAERIHALYGGDALVEAYLPGPEFNVGVLALPKAEPLPVAEVVYARGTGSWPILTYAAKWASGSVEDRASPVQCPARIDLPLADRLGRLAVAAFEATGCRDYARVDFRLDDSGAPMILEVNPNPDIGPNAGWARALQSSGREYSATVAAIARRALHRGRRRVDR